MSNDFESRVLSSLALLQSGQAHLRSDLTELRSGQTELQSGQAELQGSVAQLRADVMQRIDRLEHEIALLQADLAGKGEAASWRL
jgi:predicted  nucleic acid-binding Zn-ribbon protein